MAIGHQVVRRHPHLESSTALTTKASPDTDGGELVDHPAADLLQGELAQVVEEEPQGEEQGDGEDRDGDKVGKGNQHRGCQTWRQKEGGMVPEKKSCWWERSKISNLTSLKPLSQGGRWRSER